MAWLQLIVGSAAVVVAALQFRRLRGTPVAWPADPWIGLAIGGSLLLTGAAELTGSIAVIAAAAGGSVLGLGAAIVLAYRQHQRNIGRHLNDLEAKRKP